MIIFLVLITLAAASIALFAGVQGPLITILGIVIAAGWLLKRPLHAIGTAMALQIWGVLSLTSDGMATPYKLGIVVAAIATFGKILTVRRFESLPRAYTTGLVLLMLNICISEINAPYGSSLQSFVEFGSTVFLFFLVSQLIRKPDDFRTIAIIQAIGLTFMTVYVVAEVGWSAMMAGIIRARGPAGQPNALAEHISRTMPFALALLLDTRNRTFVRALGSVAFVGSIYMLFASASRGGAVGLSVGLITMLALSARTGFGRILGVATASAVILVVVAIAPKSFEDRVVGVVKGDERERDPTSHRLEQYAMARPMLTAQPMIGHGVTGFPTVAGRESHEGNPALHSSIIGMAVAYGFPAALILIVLMLSGFLVAARAGNDSDAGRLYAYGLASGTLAGFVCSFSSPTLFQPSLWFMASCCHVLAHHVRPRRAEAPEGAAQRLAGPQRIHGPLMARRGRA